MRTSLRMLKQRQKVNPQQQGRHHFFFVQLHKVLSVTDSPRFAVAINVTITVVVVIAVV